MTTSSFDALCATAEADASTRAWGAPLRAFVEAHDVQPPVRLDLEHGSDRVAALASSLIAVAMAGAEACGPEVPSDAAYALRLVTRGGGPEADALLGDHEPLLLHAARAAGLSAEGLPRGWDCLAAESALLLNNLLVLRGGLAALPLRTALGSEAPLAAALSAPADAPLAQLVAYSNLAFRLSLLPPPASSSSVVELKAGPGLADALVSLLGWCASSLADPEALASHSPVGLARGISHRGGRSGLDECSGLDASSSAPDPQQARAQLLHLSECVSRAAFNCLRSSGSSRLAARAVASLVALLDAPPLCGAQLDVPRAPGAASEPKLDSAKRTALQLCLAVPEESSFKALASCWRPIVGLLLPLAAELESKTEPGDRRLIVPLLVAQKVAEADTRVASEMRTHIFGAADDENDSTKGEMGGDPNAALAADAPLSAHLRKRMCSSDSVLKRVAAEAVLAVCGGDVDAFVGVAGVGNAAGLLAEMNLFSQLCAAA